MAISTYSELRQALVDWSGRQALFDRTTDFISLAEAWLGRELQVSKVETASNAEPYLYSTTIDLPDGLVWPVNITVERNDLDEYTVSFSYLEGVHLSDANQTNWLLAYSPDLYFAAAMVELSKFQRDREGLTFWYGERQALCDQVARAVSKKCVGDTLSTEIERLRLSGMGWSGE